MTFSIVFISRGFACFCPWSFRLGWLPYWSRTGDWPRSALPSSAPQWTRACLNAPSAASSWRDQLPWLVPVHWWDKRMIKQCFHYHKFKYISLNKLIFAYICMVWLNQMSITYFSRILIWASGYKLKFYQKVFYQGVIANLPHCLVHLYI